MTVRTRTLVEILEQGPRYWNSWRTRHPDLPMLNLEGIDLREADLYQVNLSNVNLQGADLSSADLSESSLSWSSLANARLDYSNLAGADLRLVDFYRSSLYRANLYKADLSRASLCRTNLHRAILSEAKLKGADFGNTNLQGADLSHADLRGANLSRANLSGANLCGADLKGADLSQATLIHTKLKGTNLSGCRIYGISAWDVDSQDARQTGLVITPANESRITVDNLEVAQFIYLLLNNKKIRDVIDTITCKLVLIFGRFTTGRKQILDAIRSELYHHDYLPVLFDFDRPASRNFTETIRTLAHMSRFIIADITDPKCVPHELMASVPYLSSVPVQPLIQGSEKPYALFEDLRQYDWVLEPYRYADSDQLIAALGDNVIRPAEAKAMDLTLDRKLR